MHTRIESTHKSTSKKELAKAHAADTLVICNIEWTSPHSIDCSQQYSATGQCNHLYCVSHTADVLSSWQKLLKPKYAQRLCTYCGECVIGALSFVDMIIRMHRLVTQLAASHFNCSVGNDLIGIHVTLGATAGLPDNQGKVV